MPECKVGVVGAGKMGEYHIGRGKREWSRSLGRLLMRIFGSSVFLKVD